MIYDLQKASFGKRISAFLFDIILLFTLAVGILWAVFAIGNYDKYANVYGEKREEYIDRYEETYGIKIDISEEDYGKLSEDDRKKVDSARKEANEAFGKDTEAAYNYGMMVNILMTGVSLGVILSFFLLEFLVPLFLHNGMTLGKKIFGVGVMLNDGVRLPAVSLFARSMLGKCAVETMVPLFLRARSLMGKLGIVGIVVLVLLVALELGLLIFNKTRPMIHDALAMTVTVDFASQLIFDSREEMIEYKKRIHKEEAEKDPYVK